MTDCTMANVIKNYEKVLLGNIQPKAFVNAYNFNRVSQMSLAHSFLLQGCLNSLSIDSTGTYLLGGEEDGRVVLYDLARISRSVNCKGEIALFKAYPNKPCPSPMDVNWFPSNEGLFSTLSCGVLKIYDAGGDTDDPVDSIDTGANSKDGWPARIYKHHPWNSATIMCMSEKEIRMYDLKVGAFVQTMHLPPHAERFSQITVSRATPYSMAAGLVIKHGCGESNIEEYDGRNWNQKVRTYTASKTQTAVPKTKRKNEADYSHSRSISYLGYSEDGQYLISHGIDGVIKKWSTESGTCRSVTRVPGNILYNPNVPGMAIIETKPNVAAVPRKDGIYLMDIDNSILLRHLKGHVSQITDIAYDPAFNRLYSVAKESMLLVWESKGSAVHDHHAVLGKPEVLGTKLFDEGPSSEDEAPNELGSVSYNRL